ncbi:unnamed protein product [Linum tenue]|uniref:GDSL esterase/lipase n=1 Tax=Linum tenue TaxID=586396 RepID=A0AAV0LY67_9ROSI|nr:unnamed protein product [Linum tenue]
MSPPASSFHLITSVLIQFLLLAPHFPLTSPQLLKGCGFSALYNLGDSLSDTGNALVHFDFGGNGKYPYYGVTVGEPSDGRFSDGLLLIDRIAESAGLPHCNPYLRKVRHKLHLLSKRPRRAAQMVRQFLKKSIPQRISPQGQLRIGPVRSRAAEGTITAGPLVLICCNDGYLPFVFVS